MPLTDTQIKGLKPAGKSTKHSDGGGLHLLVSPQGSKLWRQAYRFDGKEKTLSLGSHPVVSLADARQKREAAKKLLAVWIDPSHQARLDRISTQASNSNTFNAVADEILIKLEREGRHKTTLTKLRRLLSLARPAPRRPADRGHFRRRDPRAVREVEARGNYETARRLRATIGQVFRYAIATARAENDPTFGLRGALIAPTVTHRSAITERKAFGGLLRAIWGYEGTPETRAALQLMALLYPRPGELRQAEWAEFDLERAIWTIPSTRTKTRREHRKPLSQMAVTILQDLQKLTGHSRLAFRSIQSPLRTMSENTMNAALRRLGYSRSEATSHGFRATASTLLNESGKWLPGAIEAELGHIGADEVRRANHRAAYWDERVRMAEWWATEIDAMRSEVDQN